MPALVVFRSTALVATVLLCVASIGWSFQPQLSVGTAVVPFARRRGLSLRRDATASDQSAGQDGRIAFIVDSVEGGDSEGVIRSVSDMCIEVFFNRDGSLTPWKGVQLAYLRHMQYSDLKFRTIGATSSPGLMFVAREVVPVASADDVLEEDLIDDASCIQNDDLLDRAPEGWARGDVLGFVEVQEKRFGLGEEYDGTDDDTTDTEKKNDVDENEKVKLGKKSGLGRDGSTVRPFLSNLSVREDARRSGVGSALVETCEDAVLSWPDKDYDEMVLQVEEDNPSALQFYEKRGYQALFADPACRRFDTTGFLLKQVPTAKIAMRKELTQIRGRSQKVGSGTVAPPLFDPSGFFGKLRDAILVQN